MNKKVFKVGILVSILVIPAFLFLMAHLLGENHFALPKYFPIGVETEMVNGIETIDSVYHQVSAINGIDENGKDFNSISWTNRIVIYSAIFTTCKDICPLITSNLTKVNSAYLNDEDISLLTLTVDPIHDSAEVLGQYKSLYDIDTEKWKFLNVLPTSKVYEFLNKQLFISSGENQNTKDAYFHSENVVLVDKNGVIRGYFDATNAEKIDELIGAIKILKQEDEQ